MFRHLFHRDTLAKRQRAHIKTELQHLHLNCIRSGFEPDLDLIYRLLHEVRYL